VKFTLRERARIVEKLRCGLQRKSVLIHGGGVVSVVCNCPKAALTLVHG